MARMAIGATPADFAISAVAQADLGPDRWVKFSAEDKKRADEMVGYYVQKYMGLGWKKAVMDKKVKQYLRDFKRVLKAELTRGHEKGTPAYKHFDNLSKRLVDAQAARLRSSFKTFLGSKRRRRRHRPDK